jgi:hypothetical protein
MANFVFSQLLKDMPSKKKAHLQGIIHLPNPNITSIRNLERETKLFYALPPLENLHEESFSIFISFFTLPPGFARGRNVDANPDRCAYISAWGCEFCQVSIFAKLFCQVSIFAKLFCQTVRATPTVWQINLASI